VQLLRSTTGQPVHPPPATPPPQLPTSNQPASDNHNAVLTKLVAPPSSAKWPLYLVIHFPSKYLGLGWGLGWPSGVSEAKPVQCKRASMRQQAFVCHDQSLSISNPTRQPKGQRRSAPGNVAAGHEGVNQVVPALEMTHLSDGWVDDGGELAAKLQLPAVFQKTNRVPLPTTLDPIRSTAMQSNATHTA